MARALSPKHGLAGIEEGCRGPTSPIARASLKFATRTTFRSFAPVLPRTKWSDSEECLAKGNRSALHESGPEHPTRPVPDSWTRGRATERAPDPTIDDAQFWRRSVLLAPGRQIPGRLPGKATSRKEVNVITGQPAEKGAGTFSRFPVARHSSQSHVFARGSAGANDRKIVCVANFSNAWGEASKGCRTLFDTVIPPFRSKGRRTRHVPVRAGGVNAGTRGESCLTSVQPVLCKPWAMPEIVASSASKSSVSRRPEFRQRFSRSTCIRFIGST